MRPNDPPPRTSGEPSGGEPPPPGGDPLDALRDRIRSTQDAVGRLADEAARAAEEQASAGPRRPPPSGYAVPGADSGPHDRTGREAQALVALFEAVRGLVPRELADQLTELIRELLLLARALIDWYLERLELRRRTPAEVEDIPIS